MMEPRVPRNSRFVTSLFLVVLLLTLLLFLRLLAVFLAAIVLALVLVSLFSPVFARVCRWVGDRRRLAAGLTTALVVIGVLIPFSLILASLSAEAFAAYEHFSTSDQPFIEQILAVLYGDNFMIVRARSLLEQAGVDISPESLRQHVSSVGATLAHLLYDQIGGIASNAFRTLMHFGLMIVIMFAVLSDGPRLKAYLLDLSPLPDDQEERIVARFASISRAVFLGNGVASLLQGFFGGLGFYVFGIGSGVLWGTAIAFFAFLPIVGATVVFLPAAVYLLINGQYGLAIGFLIYNMIYVAALEYGLKPRLIGGQSQMSGVLVFLGILAGLSLFGILGLFYGPLILTMFLTVGEIYKSEYRSDLMAIHSPWMSADRAEALAPCEPAAEPRESEDAAMPAARAKTDHASSVADHAEPAGWRQKTPP